MKIYNQLMYAACILLLTVAEVQAQLPGDPGGGGDPDVGAPLDGGILTALVAGLGVSFYKFVFKRGK